MRAAFGLPFFAGGGSVRPTLNAQGPSRLSLGE